jgi:hypothetical protein
MSHLWILDCPVHQRVHSPTISRIYATLITIMNAALQRVGNTPPSTARAETTAKKNK